MTWSSKLHVLKKLRHPEVSLEDINQRVIRDGANYCEKRGA